MPRAPRIEYEDAAYHVILHQPVVHSNADHLFAETLAKACASREALKHTKDLTTFIFYAFVP